MTMKKNNPNSRINENDTPDDIRRDFLKKFGKYAVSTPAVTFTLLSPKTSKAVGSTSLGGRSAPPYNHDAIPYNQD